MSPASRAVQRFRAREEGWLIIEVMIAAMVLVLAALAIYSGLDGASKASGRNRNRSVAAYLAQQDLERMRAMTVTQLSNYSWTHTKTVAGVTYSIVSTASLVNDNTGSTSCTSGSTLASYIKLNSTVTDPANVNGAVSQDSLISPRAADGAAAVQIVDRTGTAGVSGVSVGVVEPPSPSRTTDANGCAQFGFLSNANPWHVSFASPGYVDPSGANAITGSLAVVPGSSSLTQFQYDRAASIVATFKNSAGTTVNGTDIVAANNLVPGSGFRPYSGTAASTMTASNLFPFTGGYRVYAGVCTSDDPTQFSGQTAPTATPAPGGTANVNVVMPTVKITITNSFGTALNAADVWFTDGCSDQYRGTTNSSGVLNIPLPYGTYSVCADDNSGSDKASISNQQNNSAAGKTFSNVAINTSANNGACP